MVVCCFVFSSYFILAGSRLLVSVLALRHREDLDSNLEKVKGAVWRALSLLTAVISSPVLQPCRPSLRPTGNLRSIRN